MNPAKYFIAAFISALPLHSAARASDTQSTPEAVGVRIEKSVADGVHFSQGSGISLGGGRILTAAHVVAVNPGDPNVTVLIDGKRMTGVVTADGSAESLDLALIRLPLQALSAARRDQPEVAVCPDNPAPSRPVVVAGIGAVARTFTFPKPFTADGGNAGTWTNLLTTGFPPGYSGSGAFDSRRGCLWGILTLQLAGTPKSTGQPVQLTAMIPALQLADFIAKHP